MATKYQSMFRNVKPVEVTRETAACVWVDGQMRRKDSSWRPVFGTEREAWQHAIAESVKDVEAAEKTLAFRVAEHNNLLGRVPAEFK